MLTYSDDKAIPRSGLLLGCTESNPCGEVLFYHCNLGQAQVVFVPGVTFPFRRHRHLILIKTLISIFNKGDTMQNSQIAATNHSADQPTDHLMACINPANGETITTYPLNTVEDVFEAVKKARAAQVQWKNTPLKERIRYVKKFSEFIYKRATDIAQAISLDNGKTLTDAMVSECAPAAMATGFYCRNAKKFLKDKTMPIGNILLVNKRSKIVQIPYGVVGIISPWNYPFSIPYSEVIMGLLAGNAVILKTASETQVVGHILKECIESAGLPKDVFTYINLPGRVAGDAFLEAGVDKLFFTGSVSVGKYLMKKASETLTPFVLELGGNDPMIVCDDADIYRAVSGAIWAGFQNAGQSCGGVERIYVHRSIYKEFIDLMKEKIDGLVVGNGQSEETHIGAITTRRQMDLVNSHIEDALKKGATIYAQSKAPDSPTGQFLPCTVLTDVNHTMAVMKDETFGPVVGVMPYDTIEEAIALANDSNLGLSGSVWSKNHGKAKKIAKMINVGSVMINDHLASHGLSETPWGGVKESGIGRTHGEIGFLEMTRPLCIVDDLLAKVPFYRRNFWWPPFSKMQYNGMKGIIDLLLGENLAVRFVGFSRLCRAFFKSFLRR